MAALLNIASPHTLAHHQLISKHGDQRLAHRLAFDEESAEDHHFYTPTSAAATVASSPYIHQQNNRSAGAGSEAVAVDCCDDVCDPQRSHHNSMQPTDIFPGLMLPSPTAPVTSAAPFPYRSYQSLAVPFGVTPQSQQAELFSAVSLPTGSPAMAQTTSFPSSLFLDTESDDTSSHLPSTPIIALPSPAVPSVPLSLPSPPTTALAMPPNPWAASPAASPHPSVASAGGDLGAMPLRREQSFLGRDIGFDLLSHAATSVGSFIPDSQHDPLPELYSDLPYTFDPATAPSAAPLNFEYALAGDMLSSLPAPAPPAPAAPVARMTEHVMSESIDAADDSSEASSPAPMTPESVVSDASELSESFDMPALSLRTPPLRGVPAPVPVTSTPLVYADSLPPKAERASRSSAASTRSRTATTASSTKKAVRGVAASSSSTRGRDKVSKRSEKEKPSAVKGEVREVHGVPAGGGPPLSPSRGPLASVGLYTREERRQKIERYKAKRLARIARMPPRASAPTAAQRAGPYACRKSFAERRPRVGGRFVKMDDETKRYLSLTKPGAPATATPDITPPPAILAWNAANQHAHHQHHAHVAGAGAGAPAAPSEASSGLSGFMSYASSKPFSVATSTSTSSSSSLPMSMPSPYSFVTPHMAMNYGRTAPLSA